jgi:hypothetical protein
MPHIAVWKITVTKSICLALVFPGHAANGTDSIV